MGWPCSVTDVSLLAATRPKISAAAYSARVTATTTVKSVNTYTAPARTAESIDET